MTYQTGTWGEDAKRRSKARREYFKEYKKKKGYSYTSHGESMGYQAEKKCKELLSKSKWTHFPTDLEWKGLKIVVKSAKKQRGWTGKKKANTYRWKFYLSQKGIADAFIFVCNDKDGKCEHIFLIPDKDIKSKHFSLSENSIPTKYLRYRLVNQY
jgi:hypothetical protein